MIALGPAELLNISTLAEQVWTGKRDDFKDVWPYLTLASAVVLVRRKMTPDPPAGLSNYWFSTHGCTKPKVILLLFMCRDQRQSHPWKKPSQTPVKMFNHTKLHTETEKQQLHSTGTPTGHSHESSAVRRPNLLNVVPLFWIKWQFCWVGTSLTHPAIYDSYNLNVTDGTCQRRKGDINKDKRYTNDIKIWHSYQQFRTEGNIYKHRQYVPIFTIVRSHVGTRRFHVAEAYSDHRRSLSWWWTGTCKLCARFIYSK